MKFTSKDLMKAMGLSVGDRIKISVANNEFIYEIRLNAENKPYLLNEQNLINCGDVHSLIDMDIDIRPRPKRVGDLRCDGKCPLCPCIYVCNDEINAVNKTLYEILELGIATFTKTPQEMNKEIHDVIKARLDKAVE